MVWWEGGKLLGETSGKRRRMLEAVMGSWLVVVVVVDILGEVIEVLILRVVLKMVCCVEVDPATEVDIRRLGVRLKQS